MVRVTFVLFMLLLLWGLAAAPLAYAQTLSFEKAWGGAGTGGSKPVSVSDLEDFADSPTGDLLMVIGDLALNPHGSKPSGVGYQQGRDTTPLGYLRGMVNNTQPSIFDTNAAVDANGRPVGDWPLILTIGGPDINAVSHYYEHTDVAADRAPVTWSEEGTDVVWRYPNGTEVVRVTQASTNVPPGTSDVFAIQILRDADNRTVVLMYGERYTGTWAAAELFKFGVYPNIASWTAGYYIVRWSDAASGASANMMPDFGDGFTILGCGEGGKKIAIVYDVGGRGDLSFNDMAFKGGADAGKTFGVCTVELASKSESDYVPNLETAANDPDIILIVGVGFALTDAIAQVAAEYPEKNFVIIDSPVPDMPNVMSILFEEHKGSAIVGALAALTAANFNYSHVGVVLGVEIPPLWKFEIGYKWGVDWAMNWYQNEFNETAPGIGDTPVKERVLWNYTGTFSNVTKGYEAAKPMYAQDAIAVYNVAGPLGLGINQAVQEIAEENNLTSGPPFWIGVDEDQDWINPGFVLASMMKRVDRGVYFATQLVIEGKFRQVVADSNGVVTLGIGTIVSGIAIDGISVSTLADLDEFIQMGLDAGILPMPPDEVKAKVTAMRNAIPGWIWDAAKELEDAIRSDPTLVPLATTTADVEYWRGILG
jgi:basic membrane protein A